MTWKEERDALIAQTMAFVQSVTGKPADFAQFELPAVPAGTPVTPQQAAVERPTHVTLEHVLAARAEIGAWRGGNAQGEIPGAVAEAARPSAPHSIASEASSSALSPAPPERFTSIASQLDLQRDMQAEIRARVARFRAHQERFNRERQEYFSATLARLKASAERSALPED
ncbi:MULTISPECIES: hypothetical protein [unclassified Bradyrhizobium]|uniref:hypothetical protein n=1 Tax=unclassified Bradyrhizobium TaxID=2631580 RepID=UPI0028EDCD9B|nr:MULTISPECIES: hypothetical protein [unclassified Bradyrhizobium]